MLVDATAPVQPERLGNAAGGQNALRQATEVINDDADDGIASATDQGEVELATPRPGMLGKSLE